MARTTERAPLLLNAEQQHALELTANSRTAPFREKQRANILILYSKSMDISQIKKKAGASRPTIYKCIDKALETGIESALKDTYHRPKPPTITDDAKTWIINLACTKPTEHGYAAEMWTRSLLAKHAREIGPKQGYTCLAKAVKAMMGMSLYSDIFLSVSVASNPFIIGICISIRIKSKCSCCAIFTASSPFSTTTIFSKLFFFNNLVTIIWECL